MRCSTRFQILVLCAVVVLSALPALSQTQESGPEDLAVYLGYTVYPNPQLDSVAVVEFPFSFNRDQLEFFRPDTTGEEDTTWHSRVFAQIQVYDTVGYPIDTAQTYFSVVVPTAAEAEREDFMIIDKLKLALRPGQYSAELTVIDVVSKAVGESFVGQIVVDSLDKTNLHIGGTSIAFAIRRVGSDYHGGNPRLVRNGYLVVPNPTGIFQTTDSVFYVYGEVYNLDYSYEKDTKVRVTYSAVGDDGVFLENFGSRELVKPGPTMVLAQSFSMKSWPAGGFKLRVAVEDLSSGMVDTAMVPLRRVTPTFIEFATSPAGTYDPYDSLSLETQINVAWYALGADQQKILKTLTDDGKRNFLDRFWRENDSDPSTPIIENRLQAIVLYNYANDKYSNNAAKDNGWASDRGRILMTYGMYDEIDDVQAPQAGNPFQVWYYRRLREGKLFVFEDWSGNYDFRLVHSNVYGEIYSADWEELLRSGFTELEGR